MFGPMSASACWHELKIADLETPATLRRLSREVNQFFTIRNHEWGRIASVSVGRPWQVSFLESMVQSFMAAEIGGLNHQESRLS